MEVTMKLISELCQNPDMMWVVGGGEVVSENNANGIKEPEVDKGYVTITAENWHFHLKLDSVTEAQFVEAISHSDMRSYYVRFSHNWDETLVRCYFPNPYLDEDNQRTELQPEKLKAFEEMRSRYEGVEKVTFVQRAPQPAT